ncbi:MAG TPA: hypothetical protein VFL80_12655 [Thermoanaerobaculia bacterium]|nr:hypothetical protein [Thermoanaerobaculia bacterium]
MRREWRSRFGARGVFWRQVLRWAVLNVPVWLEPMAIATWSLFFLFSGAGRRGVMRNLSVILPGSSRWMNLLRTYRVFWNFAWTMSDTVRFNELRTVPDWEFEGLEYFEELSAHVGGAIVLTAHLGSYDLGAHLFAEVCGRTLTMVRAPEEEESTQEWESRMRARSQAAGVRVGFSTSNLAFDLLAAIQRGEIVAIQGDRTTKGVASVAARMFGEKTMLPSGPFALAMAARVPIYPLFVVRRGRRRYRLMTAQPFEVRRTTADRDRDLEAAVVRWTATLESVLRESWDQWFAFEPFAEAGS